MITRTLEGKLIESLRNMPVVVILGPRQVGKTTLALDLAKTTLGKPIHYLDLELTSDLAKLDDAECYLRRFENQLLVIDEVQRKPELFPVIRALVDLRKRNGERAGHFLLLGPASRDLLQQSSESLAGRIRYLELNPFSVNELHLNDPLGFNLEKLWFRGGFPDSYLAESEIQSQDWRRDFISTYVGIEIKKSSAPTIRSGFHRACEDIGATKKYVVYSGSDRFPMRGDIEAVGLIQFLGMIAKTE